MTGALIKVLAVVMIAAGATITLAAYKSEYAFLLCLACGAAALVFLSGTAAPYITRIRTEFQKADGAASCFAVALKALGISYLTGFVADTCRDFGQTAYAAKAELAGKCAIFILCVPPAISVLEAALRFAGV